LCFTKKHCLPAKKLSFQSQLTKHQADSKKTWEILRKIVNNKKRKENSISSVLSEGETLFEPGLISNKFNDFFSEVASSILNEMHPPANVFEINFFDAMEDPTSDNLNFVLSPLTNSEIVEAINLLNDKLSQDENGLSSNFIKRLPSQSRYP
jgi:hypothetical protein